MGAYVSNYRLAHAVASEGDAIGMVSGVAMDNILARVLQVIVFTTSGRRLFATSLYATSDGRVCRFRTVIQAATTAGRSATSPTRLLRKTSKRSMTPPCVVI